MTTTTTHKQPSSADAGRGALPHWLEVVADPVRLHILRSLSRVAEATVTELASRGNISKATLHRHLARMITLGVIQARAAESDGETPGRPATRYSLTPAMRASLPAPLGIPR